MSRLLKRILFFLAIFCLSIELHAAQMNETQIRQAAQNWLDRNKIFQREAGKGNTYRVETVSAIDMDQQNTPLAFHVDLSPKGYLIISGNDLISPVIAFSAMSNLNLLDHPDNAFRTLLFGDLEHCHRALAEIVSKESTIRTSKKNTGSKNQLLWQKLLAQEISSDNLIPKEAGDSPLIGPLMTTSWNQNRHYNELCPLDSHASSHYNGRMPTGCVATAGGQLMKYYNWPTQGTGSHSYFDETEELAASFSDPYDWSAMLDTYDPWGEEPQEAVDAVSELLYELGVSIEMNYDPAGSSASMGDLNSSLTSHFYYETGSFIYRSDDEAAFDAAVYNNIIAQRVVVTTYPGHAIVVDGLDQEEGEDFYHINYGWGGLNNGWYKLTEVPIDSSSGSETRSLFSGLFDIRPQFLPLLKDFTDQIDTDGEIDIIWSFPDVRRSEVTQFQIFKGEYETMEFFDSCDDLTDWTGSSYWQVASDEGYTADGFYFPPDILGYFDLNLAVPVRANTDTILSFRYKAVLYDAHLFLQTSVDNGETWVTRFDVTSTPGNQGWLEAQIDIADQPEDFLIRFRSEFESGSYWPSPHGGIWLDDIRISGAEFIAWQVAADSLPPSADQYQLSLQNGSYYFSMRAGDSQGWGPRSPTTGIVIQIPDVYADFDQDNDVDGRDIVAFTLNGAFERLSEVAADFGRQQ
ncbi:MAG: hypothetical protein GY699_02235 [Desulfobacteraceae bacterium]|nr:hypothetical protein [Desulfobacteraceae bacterium]